jgi:hypothetical protein
MGEGDTAMEYGFFRVARRSIMLWFGAAWLLVGSFFFLKGAYEILQERRYQTERQVAQGTVLTKSIDRARRDGNPRTKYTTTYRFSTMDGRIFEDNVEVSVEEWERLEVGSPLRITHLPDAPQSSRIAGKKDPGSALASAALGGTFALIGGVFFFRSLRQVSRGLRLRREGTVAEATIVEVAPSSITINRVPQWQIHYRYQDHFGQNQEGKSEPFPPDEVSDWHAGDTGVVRFDQQRPQDSVWIGKG